MSYWIDYEIMSNTQTPICMCEGYWANIHFSVARYAGGIKAFGHEYQIVNKQGATLFELSDRHSKYYVGDGNRKAIEPGEPADLCRTDFIPFYKKLGREAFLQVLKEHSRTPDTELKKIYKELTKKEKECQSKKKTKVDTPKIGKLFEQES